MSWNIDPAHSHIQFSVRHLMISTVRGSFNEFTGAIEFDEVNPLKSTIDVTINAASIDTREQQREDHLRSPDFFDVEKYPNITFKSTRIEQTGDKTGRLIGNLTIRDVTKEVTLDVEYAGQAKSPWGTTSAGFTASGPINREDYGLKWNQTLETGGFLVGDKIKLDIEVELIKQLEGEADG